MKHPPTLYAKALKAALKNAPQEKQEEVIKNFLAILARKNLGRLAPKILRKFEEELVRDSGGRIITLESARPIPRELRESLRAVVKKEDRVTYKTDPRHIAGVKIVINGEEALDGTLRRKLRKLFA